MKKLKKIKLNNGKDIDNKIILNIANSFIEKDDKLIDNDTNFDNNKIYSTTKSDNNYQFFGNYNNSEKTIIKNEENNIKKNFLENKNSNINEYQEKSFLNGAMCSLGKLGNKLKDQLKVAKDAVLSLELNLNYKEDNIENKIENKSKESKMSYLFDLPNKNQEEKEVNSKINNIQNQNLINIIKRLERIDNKYNKYFDREDKNELKNIISELLK